MQMPDELGNFHEDTLEELIRKMWRYGSDNDMRYRTLRAELDRRISVKQIKAADAQIEAAADQKRSAWYQLAAVVAMFLTVIATLVAPLLAHG
jgi:hypothetical protein